MIDLNRNIAKVPKWMTWERFGSTKDYFIDNIQDKELEIINKAEHLATWGGTANEPHTLVTNIPGRRFFILKDANNETWSVNELDLLEDKKEAERRCWPWLKEPIREQGYEAVAAQIEKDLIFRSEPKEKLRAELRGAIYNAEMKGVLNGLNLKAWSNRLRTDTMEELEAAIIELRDMMEEVEK